MILEIGITSQDYLKLQNDSDSKAFYGAIITQLKNETIKVITDKEELITKYSCRIKKLSAIMQSETGNTTRLYIKRCTEI